MVVNVALHVGSSHARPSAGILARAAAGLLGGAIVTATLSAVGLSAQSVAPVDAATRAVVALLTYLALGFGYFNFVNLNMTSLRIRLLRELLDHHPHGLTRDEIVNRYGADTVMRLRLARLLGTEHIVRRGDRYYLGRRNVLLISRTIDLLRRIVIPRGFSPGATE